MRMATSDWKAIAAARGLGIPGEQLARIAPSLDALEAAFRPLSLSIPHLTEPALVYQPEAEETR